MTNARFTSALEVFELFPSAGSDISSDPHDEPLLAYIDRLVRSEAPEDAISFCAYALDRREAVWWASQCTRSLGSPVQHEEEVALLTAEAWVRDPEENRRKQALDIGLNGNHELPGVWVAMAAGGAGGHLTVGSAPQGPPVPAHMAAKAARAAVLIALARMPLRERGKHIADCAEFCRKLLQRQ